jgi:hypothetical protein
MNDQQLQQLLTSASLPAPQTAWANINALLDEEAEDAPLLSKLQSAELEAPTFVWNEIETELNAFSQEKVVVQSLAESEITPPAFVWEKIETALTIEDDAAIAAKLNNAEVEAPAKSWELIEEQLQPAAKVIPITKRFAPVFQLAAAAVVVGLLAWGAFQLFTNMNEQELIAAEDPKQNTDTNQKNNSVVTAETTTDEIKQNEEVIASIDPATIKRNKASVQMPHEKPPVKKTRFSETNYLLVLDDKGELIRVSKKLSSMDCAKTNEVPVDAVTALQAKDCEDKIKRLQQKMATSIFGSVLDPGTINTTAEK